MLATCCIHMKLQCVAVCCSVLQCVAVCCSVLQCVAYAYSLLFVFRCVCDMTHMCVYTSYALHDSFKRALSKTVREFICVPTTELPCMPPLLRVRP